MCILVSCSKKSFFITHRITRYIIVSVDIVLTRSNHKIAYGLILQHILNLKQNNFQGQIVASDVSESLQIPYRTVVDVFNKLQDEQIIQISSN